MVRTIETSDAWIDARFRANPELELTLFDRLPPNQRELLAALREEPEFYGILHNRERPELGVKSAAQDIALLFLTLREPGPLPRYVRDTLGARLGDTITSLVLDAVLEVEVDGRFISGPSAVAHLAPASSTGAASTFLGRLSVAALRTAQAFETRDGVALTAALYGYNRWPASPRWLRRFPDADAVARALGFAQDARNEPVAALLARHWRPVRDPEMEQGWFLWRAKEPKRAPARGGASFKLYVSPACSHVESAFRTAVEVFTELGVASFKVGRDAYGLLRPDKLVAYFDDQGELARTADELARRLQGTPAHGVPFTSEIAAAGLLSWGMDPPPSERPPGAESESWRSWVVARLAHALVSAREADAGELEPWEFALQRVALEGVDCDTWTPKTNLWSR